MPPSKYRLDIDGLRALAVTSVVIYHTGISLFPGGFVGVDVFFVISGYLISRILITEVDSGRFSLGAFYERRIRRIIPALAVMMAVTAVLSALLLYPSTFRDFGASLVAAVFSVSNIFFLFTSDYFASDMDTKPLLHTWSLGVEEQFYIFFPLILILIARYAPRARLAILVAIAVVSLAISLAGNVYFPTTNFYSPQTRAWELLAGTFLALDVVKPVRNAVWANLLATAGLVLIVAPIQFYSATTPFPGYGALPPVLGAVLLIHTGAGGQTWVSRLLGWAPVVFVGQISYSLYLWHWPVLKLLHWPIADFATTVSLFAGVTPWMIKLGLVGLSVLLAILSWRFVERPFRQPSPLPRTALYARTAAVGAVFAVLGTAFFLSNGWAQRFSPEVVRLAAYANGQHAEYREGSCFLTSSDRYEDYRPDTCLREVDGKTNYLLIGDSHAAHLWYGLSQTLDGHVMQANASGCKPVLHQPSGAVTRCARLMNAMFSDYLRKNRVDMVILSARWTQGDLGPLRTTLDYLKAHNIRTVVLGPVVQYQYALPYALAGALRARDPSLTARLIDPRPRATDKAMAEMVGAAGVTYGSSYQALCPGGVCTTVSPQGVPVQFDYGHLTADGSLIVAQRLKSQGVFDVKSVDAVHGR